MQAEYKAAFPLLQKNDIAYLDNAATAQRPQCVLDAMRRFYEEANANPLRGLYPLSIAATDALEHARETAARFLGAEHPEEIIFTRNTTEGLNLVAYSYALSHLQSGDEVLVSIMEHHSNLLPWQLVCERTGAQLRFLECEKDGSLDAEKAVQAVTPRTKLVALTQLSNVLGAEYPVRAVADAAHAVGAVMVVDGAQSTPHIPVDVKALGADFFACSGHKLYGPMGIGILYGKRALLLAMPPFLRGGEMIESVHRDGAVFAELPHKFEAGTPDAASAAGLAAAIDFIEAIGFDAVREAEDALCAYTLPRLASIPGVHIVGSEDPAKHHGILTFTLDGVHPHDVSEILAADGVCVRTGHHCAQPLHEHLGLRSTTRASFAFYNTKEDADRFLQSLKTVRGKMGYGNQ